MTDKINGIKSALDGVRIGYSENEMTAGHTSFRIGGKARLFVSPENAEDLHFVLDAVRTLGVPSFILGKGTNVVFSDDGFDGVVISTLALAEVKVEGNRLTAEAGATMAKTATVARDNSLTGMEFAHGIPGSVGGGVYMNAGAYGGELSGILSSSTYLDTLTGELHTISNAEHCFGYRESIYKHHPEWVIVSATFELKQGDRDEIGRTMEELAAKRRDKQPLEYPSAGSAFKRYPGYFTAQLIDEAGLKGLTVGGAQVSVKHAGFIINVGGATASDVRELVSKIKAVIHEKNGIEIEEEIIFVK